MVNYLMHLEFRPVSFTDKNLIDHYSFLFGEKSCQHSFVSMYGHANKYGDSIFEKDNWLYICRQNLVTPDKKVYLSPLGNLDDKLGFNKAIENILTDAHTDRKRVEFGALTTRTAELLSEQFPNRFNIYYDRDYSEYIYSREKLIELTGKKLSKRRGQYNAFMREYGDRVQVKQINLNMIPEIKVFQNRWLKERISETDNTQLTEENQMIIKELDEFDRCGLVGICVFIDDQIVGYSFGVALSGDCFDIICEKGDRKIKYIYQFIKHEMPKYCDKNLIWINWEEDVGDLGLRQVKEFYYPEFLINKFIAEERVCRRKS